MNRWTNVQKTFATILINFITQNTSYNFTMPNSSWKPLTTWKIELQITFITIPLKKDRKIYQTKLLTSCFLIFQQTHDKVALYIFKEAGDVRAKWVQKCNFKFLRFLHFHRLLDLKWKYFWHYYVVPRKVNI